jgi:hypothetical protein
LANGQVSGTATWTVGGTVVAVPGSWSFTSALGTVLNAGAGQSESVTFTPTDGTDYLTLTITVTINVLKATPTITWANPANIPYGTPLGAAQLDAIPSVPGTFVYNPGFGAVLPAGQGRTLVATFTPADHIDFTTVTSSVRIDVLPPQAMVIGEQPVFQRKLNSKGKPTGKVVLTGFTLDFNMPLSAGAASNPGNYELDTVTYKKVKKSLVPVLHPIKSFTVKYAPASDSVTLKLTAAQSFPTGGRLTVLPGVTGGSGSVLVGTTVFKITVGGKTIEPS